MTSCNFIHTTTRFSGNLLPGPLSYGDYTKNYQEHVKNESFQSQKCCKGLALNLAGVIHRRIPHSDFAYCFSCIFLARSDLENDGLGGSQYSIVERTTDTWVTLIHKQIKAMTLERKGLHLSDPQRPHLYSDGNNSIYLTPLLQEGH